MLRWPGLGDAAKDFPYWRRAETADLASRRNPISFSARVSMFGHPTAVLGCGAVDAVEQRAVRAPTTSQRFGAAPCFPLPESAEKPSRTAPLPRRAAGGRPWWLMGETA